jgi:hypothetical protein
MEKIISYSENSDKVFNKIFDLKVKFDNYINVVNKNDEFIHIRNIFEAKNEVFIYYFASVERIPEIIPKNMKINKFIYKREKI